MSIYGIPFSQETCLVRGRMLTKLIFKLRTIDSLESKFYLVHLHCGFVPLKADAWLI